MLDLSSCNRLGLKGVIPKATLTALVESALNAVSDPFVQGETR